MGLLPALQKLFWGPAAAVHKQCKDTTSVWSDRPTPLSNGSIP